MRCHALKKEAFHASILTMKLGDEAQRVLLRDVQMHPFRHAVLHVDFQRVDENKKIHMKVPLHFVNAEIAPAVKMAGGIVSHVLNELDVSACPRTCPSSSRSILSHLAVGIRCTCRDLKLPAGVTAVTRPGASPVVATVVPRSVEEDAEVAAPRPQRPQASGGGGGRRQAGRKERGKGRREASGQGCRQRQPAKKDDKK